MTPTAPRFPERTCDPDDPRPGRGARSRGRLSRGRGAPWRWPWSLPSEPARRRHDAQQGRDDDRAGLSELGLTVVRFNFRGAGGRKAASTTAAAKSRTCWRSPTGRASRGRTMRCGWPVSPSAPGSRCGPRRVAAGSDDLDRAAGRARDFAGDGAADVPVAGDPGRGRRNRRTAGGLRVARQAQSPSPSWCACPTPGISSIAG